MKDRIPDGEKMEEIKEHKNKLDDDSSLSERIKFKLDSWIKSEVLLKKAIGIWCYFMIAHIIITIIAFTGIYIIGMIIGIISGLFG